MRGDVVVVFARVPRLGTVKRRLARDIGALAALQLYRRMLAATLAEARAGRRHRTVLVMTGRNPPHGAERQGRGDLGQRMAAAFAARPRRRVVLVGCDIPALRRADLHAAFAALGRAQAVFGPATDGGYWLVGMGPRRPAHPFRRVRWSSEHALADTLANFRGRPVALLRRLQDLDSAADLHAAFGSCKLAATLESRP